MCLCGQSGDYLAWIEGDFKEIWTKAQHMLTLPDGISLSVSRELQRLRRNFFRGFLYAALDAHFIYQGIGLAPPMWVVQGVGEIEFELFAPVKRGRGRPSTRLSRFRCALLDRLRLDMFGYVKQKQVIAREDRRLVKLSGDDISKFEKYLVEIGSDKDLRFGSDHTLPLTCDELAGTARAVGCERLKSSCKRARRSIADDIAAGKINVDFLCERSTFPQSSGQFQC